MPDGWFRVQDYEEYLSIENEPPSLYQNNQYNILKRKRQMEEAQTIQLTDLETLNTNRKPSQEEMRKIREEERERKLIEREAQMNRSALFCTGMILIVLVALTLFAHFVIWITPGLSWDLIVQNLVFGILQGVYYLFKSFYWLCETIFNYVVIDLIGFQF